MNTLEFSLHSPLSSFCVPFINSYSTSSLSLKEVSQTFLTFSCYIVIAISQYHPHLSSLPLFSSAPLPLCFAIVVTSENWFLLPVSLPPIYTLYCFQITVFWTFLPCDFSTWNCSSLFQYLQDNFFKFLRNLSRISREYFLIVPLSRFWGECPSSVSLHCTPVAACSNFIITWSHTVL